MAAQLAPERQLLRAERLTRLHLRVAEQPELTDEELGRELGVSIHTVRADRQRLGIPEARQRTRDLAVQLYGRPRSLSLQEMVGELLEIEPDRSGLSLLQTTPEFGFQTRGIVRGHTLFAQANSLAASVVDADMALTGEAEVQFLSPVRVGERTLAKAEVVRRSGRRREIEVVIKTRERVVFRGRFLMHGLTRKTASHLKLLEPVREER
jgi:acyl-coenzyme A thioesterase PaaI-like protein